MSLQISSKNTVICLTVVDTLIDDAVYEKVETRKMKVLKIIRKRMMIVT